jgi:hypothetical protein
MKIKENSIFHTLFIKYLRQDRPRWVLYIFIVLLLLCMLMSVLGAFIRLGRLVYPATVLWAIYTAFLYIHRLIRMRSVWCYPVGALLLGLIFWSIFAGHAPDTAQLRAMYRTRLLSFSGTPYIWGGESHVGIDCSGLARTAFYEAMALEGLRTGNPRLLGPQVWDFWWHDMSAKAMGEGTYGYTHEVCRLPQLAGTDTSLVQIGDLAVVVGGIHVLICIGDNRWIEADPEVMRVVVNTVTPTTNRGDFNTPVTIMRWKWLDNNEGVEEE